MMNFKNRWVFLIVVFLYIVTSVSGYIGGCSDGKRRGYNQGYKDGAADASHFAGQWETELIDSNNFSHPKY